MLASMPLSTKIFALGSFLNLFPGSFFGAAPIINS